MVHVWEHMTPGMTNQLHALVIITCRFVTFANMNQGEDPDLSGYKFRATCLSDEELMCPRPLPDAGQCSNPISSSGNSTEERGVCQQVRVWVCAGSVAIGYVLIVSFAFEVQCRAVSFHEWPWPCHAHVCCSL